MATKEADFIEIDFQDQKNVFKALLDNGNTPITNIDKIFKELYSAHSATPGKRKKVPTKKQRNTTISLATTDLSKVLVEYIYDLMATPITETANLSMNTIDFLEILKVMLSMILLVTFKIPITIFAGVFLKINLKKLI